VHAECSHWLQEISISKTVCHHFWPGLMAGAEFWGHLFLDNQKCIGNEYIRASNNLWETLENSLLGEHNR